MKSGAFWMDIGLDVGGTKTALLARDASGKKLTLRGPGANLQRLGVEGTARVIADLIREARRHFGDTSVRGLCAGVAGAGRSEEQSELTKALLAHLAPSTPQRLVVVSDARIALEGAFEGASGLIVIAGTGSMVMARNRKGTTARAGGWGALLGDEGSAYAVGKAGLRALADAFDGGPETALRDLLGDAFALHTPDALIRRVYADRWALSEAAPVILEAAAGGDAVAEAIVREQTRSLARQAGFLRRRLPDLDHRFALLGGMNRNAYYADLLQTALLEALPGWRRHPPSGAPVEGALLLASPRR